MPARSAFAARNAFLMSFVQMAAARPYSLSFDIEMTSSISVNGMTVMTGPKISSRAMRSWLVASAKIVGGTK